MTLDERRDRGLKRLDEMLGPDRAAQVREHWQQLCPDFEGYVTEFLVGEIWTRPGLDRRTKSLVSIAALASLGRDKALKLNIQLAASNGVTKQELVETFLQLAPYAGFPVCWEGLALVDEFYGNAGNSE